MKIKFTPTTTTSMAASVTTFVATTASGSIWRGKCTCFTSVGWEKRLEHDICTADWKKTHVNEPREDEERVVLDLERLQQDREDERVDRHQRQAG